MPENQDFSCDHAGYCNKRFRVMYAYFTRQKWPTLPQAFWASIQYKDDILPV